MAENELFWPILDPKSHDVMHEWFQINMIIYYPYVTIIHTLKYPLHR